MSLKSPEIGELRIYWIPDVQREKLVFYQSVDTIEEAVKLLNTLAQYDMLRYEKGLDIVDYVNEAGVEKWNGVEWIEWIDTQFEEIDLDQMSLTIH